MSLQFIIGSSGAGKSYFAYKRIIQESLQHPEKNYYVIVPEQFTMQTQKTLVEMHPGKGILNIDILSFERLAYRVFVVEMEQSQPYIQRELSLLSTLVWLLWIWLIRV